VYYWAYPAIDVMSRTSLTTETPDYDGRQALANAHKALDNDDWLEWRFDS
jgi:hypothetical protein